jgi:hypothetical protein
MWSREEGGGLPWGSGDISWLSRLECSAGIVSSSPPDRFNLGNFSPTTTTYSEGEGGIPPSHGHLDGEKAPVVL